MMRTWSFLDQYGTNSCCPLILMDEDMSWYTPYDTPICGETGSFPHFKTSDRGDSTLPHNRQQIDALTTYLKVP